VPAAAAQDAATNSNTASTSIDNSISFHYVVDTTPPSVTVALDDAQSARAASGPAVFTVTFDEPVTGFTAGDVAVSGSAGATTATVTGSGSVYTVSVATGTAEGTVIVSLGAAVAQDLAGNDNTAGNSATVTIDHTAPTVTVARASGQTAIASSGPALFTVTFSEAVTGFTASDVTVSGSAGATSATLTGTGPVYTVSVSTGTAEGTVTISVGPAVANDLTGNANTAGNSATVTIAVVKLTPTAEMSKFVPLSPVRIFDTRANGEVGPKGLVAAGKSIDVQVAGVKGIPADAIAVVLNVTTTDGLGGGFVTAWPAGEPEPNSSNLNVTRANQTRPNGVTIKVGAGGKITLRTTGGSHLLADAFGYFVKTTGPTTDGRLVPLAPARVFDTRDNEAPGPKGFVKAKATISVQIAGKGGVPTTGAAAVVLNVTADASGGTGFVTVWPGATPMPVASSLNLNGTGDTTPNLVIVPIGTDGKVNLFTWAGAHLIGDVMGYFTDATAPSSTSGLFVPSSPTRLFDTRGSNGGQTGRVSANGEMQVDVAGHANVPAAGVGAVMLNITADNASGGGFVTVWPDGNRPNVSILNLSGKGDTRANSAIVKLDTATQHYFTSGGTHLLADTFGWFTA
jgi:Bacterial Ig-like domain